MLLHFPKLLVYPIFFWGGGGGGQQKKFVLRNTMDDAELGIKKTKVLQLDMTPEIIRAEP